MIFRDILYPAHREFRACAALTARIFRSFTFGYIALGDGEWQQKKPPQQITSFRWFTGLVWRPSERGRQATAARVHQNETTAQTWRSLKFDATTTTSPVPPVSPPSRHHNIWFYVFMLLHSRNDVAVSCVRVRARGSKRWRGGGTACRQSGFTWSVVLDTLSI